jgi:hypothetical protein
MSTAAIFSAPTSWRLLMAPGCTSRFGTLSIETEAFTVSRFEPFAMSLSTTYTSVRASLASALSLAELTTPTRAAVPMTASSTAATIPMIRLLFFMMCGVAFLCCCVD